MAVSSEKRDGPMTARRTVVAALLLDATECDFPPPRHPAGRLVPSP
jgi:hypothetical protein